MPFDGAGFHPRRDRRRPATPSDNVVTFIILAVAFCLLVMPISLEAFADIIRYLRGSR